MEAKDIKIGTIIYRTDKSGTEYIITSVSKLFENITVSAELLVPTSRINYKYYITFNKYKNVGEDQLNQKLYYLNKKDALVAYHKELEDKISHYRAEVLEVLENLGALENNSVSGQSKNFLQDFLQTLA
jgi:hypothetical protein